MQNLKIVVVFFFKKDKIVYYVFCDQNFYRDKNAIEEALRKVVS